MDIGKAAANYELVDAFLRNPYNILFASSGITRSPHNEKKQGKNMSAEATQKATSETIDKVFQEAMRSYENALKSGIQVQEESVNLWKDLLTKLGSPEDFQAKLESMTANAFPKARERMEEFVETFNRTSNQTVSLFEKTLSVYQATSVPDAQRRMHDLIESSLAALRVNVHSALNTNAKIIASWKELADRFGPAVK
jgi:coenzyme F420-reducing hydrogenase delta subunit